MKWSRALLLSSWVVGSQVACGGGADGPRQSPSGAGGLSAAAGSTGSHLSGGSSSGSTAMPSAGTRAGGGSSAGASAMGGAAGGAPAPCGPDWVAGTSYAQGDIVRFQGAYYVAEHDNPGYDPTISTYFWDPYDCQGGGGGSGGSSTGGTGPLGDSAFDDLVSESLFQQMFPDRNGFYTYQGLVNATRDYPAFSGSGSTEQRKREAAAFLANVARETGELVYIEQIQKDVYCSASAKCPCEPGKQYFGRGPLQISWNYNYCSAGAALGYDLRAQPDLVAQDATVAWATGLWFWMTQRGAGSFTPHDAVVGDHGFGETIRSINGDIECGGGSSEAVNARVSFYQRFCQLLGVDPGSNQSC